MTRRTSARIFFLPLVVLAAACGGAPSNEHAATVQRDSIGDTLVVRTVAGSAWGPGTGQLVPELTIGVLDGPEELIFGSVAALAISADGQIYALDRQIPAVRVFDSTGGYQRTLGRSGGGPGEFGSPDGGLVVLSDGRLAVRDPGNARLQVFDPSGEPSETWPVVSGGFSTSSPMYRTPGDTLLTPVLIDRDADVADWRSGLQRISPSGEIIDTLPYPESGYETPTIEARVETEGGANVSLNGVPFAPDDEAVFHPEGFFVVGVSDRYAVTLLRPGGYVRIERDVEPTPVVPGEKREAEAAATRNMRFTDPNWRWNGPAIPDQKPFFERILPSEDGRIWLLVELEGVERDDPDYDPTDPDAVENRWRSRQAFDVFEADGTYLGRVDVPDDFGLYPTPVIRDDLIWAVTRDDLGVQRIVRYRLSPPTSF